METVSKLRICYLLCIPRDNNLIELCSNYWIETRSNLFNEIKITFNYYYVHFNGNKYFTDKQNPV